MMKKFYYLFVLLIVAGIMQACDNGYADSELLDSAPKVTLSGVPANVGEGFPINFTATLQDGISEEHSKSPLASYSYSLVDTTSLAEVSNGGGTVSGRDAVVDVSVPTSGANAGIYELSFTATDTGGLTTTVSNIIEIGPYSIGIIGSATAGGWNDDTDMTQSASDPNVWTITINSGGGEAKFRLNNAWTTNWGAGDFPSGTGVQDGANIPVPAGTWDVTFNSSTGAYSFE